MCDCIKINYIPIGQEPVTIEVTSNGVENAKNFYEFIYDSNLFKLYWNGSIWVLVIIVNENETTLWQLFQDSECPIGNFINDDDNLYFSGFSTEECNLRRTITYSKVAEGWNSFWSYQPDWMTEMNSTFYTFKNGELWKHNYNTTRNNFYGEQYSSTIRGIFNNDPLTVKMFNTLSLNSTHPWSADIYTNINAGSMDFNYFVEKENQWYSYIRRFDNTIDVKALSTQGVGNANNVDVININNVILSFDFKLDSSISVGDQIYRQAGSNLVLIGTITGLTQDIMTLDCSPGSIPATYNFLICVKNSQAESFGARGYYMNVYLSNDLTEQVKLFSIGTSVFKSFL